MSETRQDRLTFEAEEAWHDEDDLAPPADRLNLRRTAGLLCRLLPPQLTEDVRITELRRPQGRGAYQLHASSLVLPQGPVFLEFVFPAPAALVTHEAAHVLIDSYVRRPVKVDHDDEFRTTHLWCVRHAFGLKQARRLGEHYDRKGLGHA